MPDIMPVSKQNFMQRSQSEVRAEKSKISIEKRACTGKYPKIDLVHDLKNERCFVLHEKKDELSPVAAILI
jgi:hypothetical protein